MVDKFTKDSNILLYTSKGRGRTVSLGRVGTSPGMDSLDEILHRLSREGAEGNFQTDPLQRRAALTTGAERLRELRITDGNVVDVWSRDLLSISPDDIKVDVFSFPEGPLSLDNLPFWEEMNQYNLVHTNARRGVPRFGN